METWHAVCALTSDDDDIQAARDFFCMDDGKSLDPLEARPSTVALVALESCQRIPVVTVREDIDMSTYIRSVRLHGRYDYYIEIGWSPENITATLRTPHSDDIPGETLLQDWHGGFFIEPIPSTYLLELFFSEPPETVTFVGAYVGPGRRPHRDNICCFQVAGKMYYAANQAIVPAHPIALGWHFHKSVSVQQLMYGPLPQPQ
jgi:hypothetical protein